MKEDVFFIPGPGVKKAPDSDSQLGLLPGLRIRIPSYAEAIADSNFEAPAFFCKRVPYGIGSTELLCRCLKYFVLLISNCKLSASSGPDPATEMHADQCRSPNPQP